jgi:orotate phosphoribosyltransferase
VINAGSAVKGTLADLQDCGATVAAVASLLVRGTAAADFASANKVPLLSLATLEENNLWAAAECPLCTAGVGLSDPGRFAATLASPITSGGNQS